MKRLALLLCLGAGFISAHAQQRTSTVSLYAGTIAIPYDGTLGFNTELTVFGLRYEHRLTNKYSVRGSFEYPRSIGRFTPASDGWTISDGRRQADAGDVNYRLNYKFVDLTGLRNFAWGRSQLQLGAGPTIAWGQDAVYDEPRIIMPNGYFNSASYHLERAAHLGVNASAGYNFFILRNRLSAGAVENVRYLIGSRVPHLNTCVTLSYSFGRMSK